MSIYVGNLPGKVTQSDLGQVFEECGTVNKVTLPRDRYTVSLRGFAFVEMGTPEEESTAIEALDGDEWMGSDLKVSKARPRKDRRSSGWH